MRLMALLLGTDCALHLCQFSRTPCSENFCMLQQQSVAARIVANNYARYSNCKYAGPKTSWALGACQRAPMQLLKYGTKQRGKL